MSGKPKFAKLRLPTSKTKSNGTSNSQISSFFSKSSQKTENTTTESNDESRDSCISDAVSNHSNESSNNDDHFVSQPKQPKLDDNHSSKLAPDPASLKLDSFDSSRPAKLRRVDIDSTTAHSTIKEFFSDKQLDESDLEISKRAVKKATTNLGRTKKPAAKSQSNVKKQPKIRNVLLKREQILSNFIAEQSMAEHVDPNEIQMALALSRSEMETCGGGIGDNDDSSGGSSSTVDVIRDKLEEFGYKVGRTYGGFGAPKGRGKWANKFTSLTLRDPERQQEKLNQKIEEFLNSQYTPEISKWEKSTDDTNGHFAITSDFLNGMKPQNGVLHLRHADYEDGKLDEFYVGQICQPTGCKMGNLLKDYRCIPGRDKSPERLIRSEKNCQKENDLQLEEVTEGSSAQINSELVEDNKTENMTQNMGDLVAGGINVPIESCSKHASNEDVFIREPSPDLFDDDEDDLCTNSNSEGIVLAVTSTSEDLTNQSSSIAPQVEPLKPPIQMEDGGHCIDVVSLSSESNSNGIATCERFSSDDVRTTANGSGIWNQDLKYTLNNLRNSSQTEKLFTDQIGSEDNIIDLTQLCHQPVPEINIDSKQLSEKRGSIYNDEQDVEKVIDLTQEEITLNNDSECLSQNSLDSTEMLEAEEDHNKNQLVTTTAVQDSSRNNNYSAEGSVLGNVVNPDRPLSPSSRTSINAPDCESDEKSVAGDDFEFENVIDLTQGEINPDDCNTTPERNFNDGESNEHDEPVSQASESSIIILSDDEVNYSIKIAKGLDLSRQSTEDSDDKEASFEENASIKCPSERDCEPQQDETSSTKLDESSFPSPAKNSFHSNSTSPQHQDHLNYSLAHEIMSHSFQEEFDRVESAGQNFEPTTTTTSLPRMKTDDIVCLDLTDPTPPDEPSTSRTDTNSSPIRSPRMKHTTLDHWIRNDRSDSSSSKLNKTRSDSYLLPKSPTTSKSLKRFSSSKKFNDFIGAGDSTNRNNSSLEEEEDEFDRLVHGNFQRFDNPPKTPEGISKLLSDPIKSPKEVAEEMTLDGKVYLVKTQNIKAKPDYQRMDSPTRLNELYKFGLKPLKRKQAIIMLEYIYNQTHPILVDDDEPDDEDEMQPTDDDISPSQVADKATTSNSQSVKYGLTDCCGSCLLIDDGLSAEMAGEEYIFQTNTRSKMHTARLPLHIAWYNLVKSNQRIREAILYYEPIDLQEIYGFLKGIGYRYDPKDIKRFFDRRSIIFQYDLTKDNGSNRHVRKAQKKQGSRNTIK